MSSEDKVAVVTGGGAGIGKACGLRFVKGGDAGRVWRYVSRRWRENLNHDKGCWR